MPRMLLSIPPQANALTRFLLIALSSGRIWSLLPLDQSRIATARILALQLIALCAVLGMLPPAGMSLLAVDDFHADDAFYTAHIDRALDDSLLAHLSVTEQDLIREYAKAWPQLGLFYDKLKVSGKYRSEHRIPGDDHFTVSESFEGVVKLSGFHHFRIEGRTPSGEEGTIFVTPKEIYAFGVNPATGRHFLAMKMSIESQFAQMYNSRYRFHKDPYMCGELTSLMTGADPGPEVKAIRIDRVETAHDAEDEIVTITVVCSGPGWCRVIAHNFFRNRFWARRDVQHVSADLEKRHYVIQRINCSYSGSQHGFPLLRESVHETATAAFSNDSEIDRGRFVEYENDIVSTREVMTFDEIEHIEPDPSEFDPSPFIAEMGGVGKDITNEGASSRFAIVFGISIAILFLLYLLTRRRGLNHTTSDDAV